MKRKPPELTANELARLPAFLLGVGLGGFVDGILLHQVLQWHHMLTSTAGHPMTTVAGLEANTLADGFFHVATWVVVAVGSWLMWRAWEQGRIAPPWRTHFGLLLAGWGAFNLVEGVIDHELLGIHHVRDDLGGPIGWDLGFLALGALLVLAGAGLARTTHIAGDLGSTESSVESASRRSVTATVGRDDPRRRQRRNRPR